MDFVLVDGFICIASELSYKKESDMQRRAGSSFNDMSIVQTGSSISGEMLLFRKGEMPELFGQGGKPNAVDIEFANDSEFVTIGDAMFTSMEKLPGYEKCEAARLEYIAGEITVTEITKSISSNVTIK